MRGLTSTRRTAQQHLTKVNKGKVVKIVENGLTSTMNGP